VSAVGQRQPLSVRRASVSANGRAVPLDSLQRWPNYAAEGAGTARASAIGRRSRSNPDPGERVCARPGCEQTFRRPPAIVAVGKGRYCSRECADYEKWRARGSRVPLTCEQCGCEYIVKSPYYRGRQRFCSKECWGTFRARRRLAGFDGLLFGPHVSAIARQRWGQLWGGYTEPKAGAHRGRAAKFTFSSPRRIRPRSAGSRSIMGFCDVCVNQEADFHIKPLGGARTVRVRACLHRLHFGATRCRQLGAD
jgi:hypothetical protein